MGNVMKFLPPFLKGFLHICCRGYHALFVLGKDIPLKYVFKHIFLSIVLFNLSCDLYDLSSNNLLLM